MIKSYSRLDRVLNVRICVHFPSKKVCLLSYYFKYNWMANLLWERREGAKVTHR